MERGWDKYLSQEDREMLERGGFGKRAGFGSRPAVLVIDMTYNFCGRGDSATPDNDSHQSSGKAAWQAAPIIKQLVTSAHASNVPVIYTRPADGRPDGFDRGRWADKNSRDKEANVTVRPDGKKIIDMLAPQEKDLIIEKYKPSAFFGTILQSFLVDLQVDSLIITGTATSGCVRATAIDAFSYNLKVTIVEDATFDRCQASHWISLLDIDSKYGDVVHSGEASSFIQSLGEANSTSS